MIGRTTPLNAAQSEQIGQLLKPAGKRHPWPDEISTHGGRGSKTAIIKVGPTVVVEVSADAALQADHYRHPLRLVRPRADVDPGDVETLGNVTDAG